jgi:hypothetical protein
MPAMTRLVLLAAVAAAALTPATAAAKLRVVEADISVAHTVDWQHDGVAGRQAFAIHPRKPAREAIDHLGAHPPTGAPPFTWMTSEDFTWHPPRGELRRTGGGVDCGVTRPRMRMRFWVEGLGGMGRAPFALFLGLGNVPRLDSACGGAELATAVPEPLALERGVRVVRRLRLGRRATLTGRVERGYGSDGSVDACAPRPAAGDWECAVTTATVRLRRVV